MAKNNNTTGSSPKYSTVSDEFAKITALDDSIEPALQVGKLLNMLNIYR